MAPPKKIRRDNHPSTSQKASKSNTRSEDDSDDDFVPGSHTPPGPSSTKTQPKRKSKKPSGPKNPGTIFPVEQIPELSKNLVTNLGSADHRRKTQ